MAHDKELEKEYDVNLENRRELGSGSVKYDLTVVCVSDDKKIVDTSYTVSKRQEDPEAPGKDLREMAKHFGLKKALEYEKNLGEDFSGKTFSV